MATGYGTKFRMKSAQWHPGVSNGSLRGSTISLAVIAIKKDQDKVFRVRQNHGYRKKILKTI
jgi:hypothetical protein